MMPILSNSGTKTESCSNGIETERSTPGSKNIYWVDLNRFDEKVDKITWLEIGNVLASEGFKVTLLCGYRTTKYYPPETRLNIRYFDSVDFSGVFRYSLLMNIFIWLLRSVAKEDIVFVPVGALPIATLLKFLRNCKCHLDFRTLPVEINRFRDRIDYLLFWILPIKAFHNTPDTFSFITTELKHNIETEFKLHFTDYVVWHSGVNLQHFSCRNLQKISDSDKFVVTYVGVLTKNRGIDRVIESLVLINGALSQKILLRIIGDGPELASLGEQCRSLGLEDKVEFLGQVLYEEIPEHIIGTDCFICPLLDRIEWNVSSPIKVFEYLACAKPVILTPIVAHKSIADNEKYVVWTRGFLPEHFAHAISFAFENRINLSKAAKIAPELIKGKYEWKNQGSKLANHLKTRLCSQPATGVVHDAFDNAARSHNPFRSQGN